MLEPLMIYLFGNYRALGELGTIDNETQEREWGGRGGRLSDLTLPPTSVLVYACVQYIYMYVCVPEDLYPGGASKG